MLAIAGGAARGGHPCHHCRLSVRTGALNAHVCRSSVQSGPFQPALLLTLSALEGDVATWCPSGSLQVDELIDMVKPARPPLITADDLARCGQSGVFFSCLSDVKQFYEYNYRENNMHSDDDAN